jgi:DNA primase
MHERDCINMEKDFKDFIEFLKGQASILDIISRKVKLAKSGKDWFGKCPFHSEKTASFKVNPEGNYYCFGCGAHGDVLTFLMEIEKMSFMEAVEYVASTCGVQVPKKDHTKLENTNSQILSVLEEIKKIFVSHLKSKAGIHAKKYLESRSITEESVDKFQLGFSSGDETMLHHLRKIGFSDDILLKTGVFYRGHNGDLIDRYKRRIIFPIMNSSGKCIGFGGRIIEKSDLAKYINSPESEVFVKNQNLYGYSIAKRGKTKKIILTEGYLDVIAMHQAGFDGAVAPLGTAISDTQINMCWRITDNPIIALDGDAAGIKASYRWIDKILPELTPGKSFNFAKLPQGEDPDSLLFHNEIDVISNALDNAMPLSDWIWDVTFFLYPSSTPEQKAAIVKMITDRVKLIRNESIRRLYDKHIKQKEYELYRRKFFSKRRNLTSIAPAIHAKDKIEKILLVAIINHPYILDSTVEDFAKIEFCNLLMNDIKKSILESYNKYFIIGESDRFCEEIKELEESTIGMFNEVSIHAGFLSKGVSDDEALSGWYEVYEKYFSHSEVLKDLQKVSSDFVTSFSNESWRRFKALKNESIITNKSKEEK